MLFFALIRCLKKDCVFHFRTLNDFSTDLKSEFLCDNDNNLIKYSFLSESIKLKQKNPIKINNE